jgi:hypothetical protein
LEITFGNITSIDARRPHVSGLTSETARNQGSSPIAPASRPVSETARDKLRSLLVIIAIFAVGGLSTSLGFHNALGVRASIVVLVADGVGSVVAAATHRI